MMLTHTSRLQYRLINTQSKVFINKMMVLFKMILMGTLQKLVAEGKEGVELSYRSFLIVSLYRDSTVSCFRLLSKGGKIARLKRV